MTWIELKASEELDAQVAQAVSTTVHVRAEKRAELVRLLVLTEDGSAPRMTPRGCQVVRDVADCVSHALEAVITKSKDSDSKVSFWLRYNEEVAALISNDRLWVDWIPRGWESHQIVAPVKAAVRDIVVQLLQPRRRPPAEPSDGGGVGGHGSKASENEYIQGVSVPVQ